MSYHVSGLEPCIECGTPTTGRLAHSRVPLCLTCGVHRALEWGQMLHAAKVVKEQRDAEIYAAQKRERVRRHVVVYPRSIGVRTFS